MRRLVIACAVVLAAGAVVSFALGASGVETGSRWVIRDLGTLGGPESVPLGINERGQVVGGSDTGKKKGVAYHDAFLWQNGRMRDLGPSTGEAAAINERGQVVGTGTLARTGKSGWFLWQDGRLRYHGTLKSHLDTVVAINERGQVVGTNDERAFLWNDGRLVDLTPPRMYGWWSKPVALNDRGQVLIDGQGASGLWEKGQFSPLGDKLGSVIDLNERGQVLTWFAVWQQGKTRRLSSWPFARRCEGSAINERGVVVGACGDAELRSHPVVWKGRKPTGIGISYGDRGEAVAVNDIGQVVGFTTRVTQDSPTSVRHTTRHAFVWENGRTTGLGTLGGRESEATAINNHGQIVGWAETKSGDHHAVVWTKRG